MHCKPVVMLPAHNPSGFASLNHLPLHKGGFGAAFFKAPLCKGGSAKRWGIVFFFSAAAGSH